MADKEHLAFLTKLEDQHQKTSTWAPSRQSWQEGRLTWAGRVRNGVWRGWEIVIDGGAEYEAAIANKENIYAWVDFQDPSADSSDGLPETDVFLHSWNELDEVLRSLDVAWYPPVKSYLVVRQMYSP